MDELIKLVRTYRVTAGLAERLRLAEGIMRLIERDLRFFVFGSLPHPASQDVLQETLYAIAVSLKSFQGGTVKEFWAWCYRIARNKISDHLRKQSSERAQPMSPDELWRLVDSSAQAANVSAQTRHDLKHALALLTSSKPECYDFLWNHYVFGQDYAEIAAERNMSYDNARMKISRCLDEAKALVK